MKLIDLLPATAAELIERTGRRHESVYMELVAMEARRIVRVESAYVGHERPINVWHRGAARPEQVAA